MWSEVVALFREYMGTGLIVGWFLVSVIYLLFREKRKHVRIVFVYVPVLLLLFFFNPLFSELVYGFVGDEIYYRILWLLPMTVVIAYSAVCLYGQLEGKLRLLFAAVCVVLIAVSGNFIYSNPFFRPAQNRYHMPQTVVDICDAIEVEGREVMAVFPVELIQYVRQYSPVVCMPYGREQTVDRWNRWDDLYGLMEAQVVDVERLSELAKQRMCHYVILPEDRELKGRFEDYDYILFDVIGGYAIYRDTTVYIGL